MVSTANDLSYYVVMRASDLTGFSAHSWEDALEYVEECCWEAKEVLFVHFHRNGLIEVKTEDAFDEVSHRLADRGEPLERPQFEWIELHCPLAASAFGRAA